MLKRVPSLAVAALVLTAGPAFAHVGAGSVDTFGHGFFHPLGGIDHILAMVAVGLFAANLGGAALWLVPSAFVGIQDLVECGTEMDLAVGVGRPVMQDELGPARARRTILRTSPSAPTTQWFPAPPSEGWPSSGTSCAAGSACPSTRAYELIIVTAATRRPPYTAAPRPEPRRTGRHSTSATCQRAKPALTCTRNSP